MDGACWMYFCCQHSPVQDMNVRIFQFMLSSERVWGKWSLEPMLTPREKSPLLEKFSSEEDRTHNAASSRTASPTHYQQAIPAPKHSLISKLPKKGDLSDCNNWRGITLLSVANKVFNRVLLGRMRGETDMLLREEQVGFHPSRNCTDQITA